MTLMKRRELLGLALGLALPWPAMAFPERPIRLIVPFAPGGDGDLMGRMWARYAAPQLGGGSIVVENRAGAGGAIGATEVARARGDGHVLLLGTSTTQIINPATLPTAPYDALKDFRLVGMLSVTPTCIVVHPGVPASSLKELVALLKADPGKYSYGSAGPGTVTNLTGELLKHQAGLQMVHVPYTGGGPAMQDLIAGHIPVITPILSAGVLAQHRAGRARILSVNSDARVKTARDIPTSIEAGVPGMLVEVFSAIFAPAGTPAQVMDALREATRKLRADPAFQQDVENAGAEAFAHASEEKFLREEVARWTQVIKVMGFKTQ
jgi:tripartite-type tricarboxylate transporter receptor subunit TctC